MLQYSVANHFVLALPLQEKWSQQLSHVQPRAGQQPTRSFYKVGVVCESVITKHHLRLFGLNSKCPASAPSDNCDFCQSQRLQ